MRSRQLPSFSSITINQFISCAPSPSLYCTEIPILKTCLLYIIWCAILVSKRIWNKKTFQEKSHQLWLMGTCGWTHLGPYERCKISFNIISLSLNSVGNKHDQTVLCGQAMVFETHLCLIFMLSGTDSYSGLDSTEFPWTCGWEGLSLICVLDISTG